MNTPVWPRVIARVIARNFDPKLLERMPKVPPAHACRCGPRGPDTNTTRQRPVPLPGPQRSAAHPGRALGHRPHRPDSRPIRQKAATGCDLRAMSTQGHSPCVAYASYSSRFSCADCLDRLSESRTSRPVSRCLGQEIWPDSSGSTVDGTAEPRRSCGYLASTRSPAGPARLAAATIRLVFSPMRKKRATISRDTRVRTR